MKELIAKQKELQAEVHKLTPIIQEAYLALTFKEQLAVYRELGDGFMKEEDYFTGSLVGNNISLYDDFYWERHETQHLSDIEDRVRDHYFYSYPDATTEGYDEFLEHSMDTKAQVARSMIEDCIGRATHDW